MGLLFTILILVLSYFYGLTQVSFVPKMKISDDLILYSNLFLEKNGFRVLNPTNGIDKFVNFEGVSKNYNLKVNKKINYMQKIFAYMNKKSKIHLRIFQPIARITTEEYIIYLNHTGITKLYLFDKNYKFKKVVSFNDLQIRALIDHHILAHEDGNRFVIKKLFDKSIFEVEADIKDNIHFNVGITTLFSNDNINFFFSTDFDHKIQKINKENGFISFFGEKGLNFSQHLTQNKPININLLPKMSAYSQLLADTLNNYLFRTYSEGDNSELEFDNMETVLAQKNHWLQVYDKNQNFIKEIDLGKQGLNLLGSEKNFIWFYSKDYQQNQYLLYKIPLSTWNL